jgi:aspartate/methionine/tyrosine aminotransferase
MERLQSIWENRVKYNLSESGIRPLTTRELLDGEEPDGLLDQALGYPQTNGTADLRSKIATLYAGCDIGQIQVVNGSAEANFVVLWRLIEAGDEVAMLMPNYMQTWGVARAFGAAIRLSHLLEDPVSGRWRPDVDHLSEIVTSRTRLVIICTPNNPTGGRLTASELDAIAEVAARHGAWVLSDEVYRGAELDGQESPSMWGRYERAIVTSGLSKAYGLPGLRIGWIVAPPEIIEGTWAHHDYTTIAPGALNDRLARVALSRDRRCAILGRSRTILNTNLPVIEGWLRGMEPALSWVRPEAGAIVYVRYDYRINSGELCDRLREEKGVLVVPGDHFGMDGYLRLGFGEPADYLRTALERVGDLLRSLPRAS